MITKNKLHDLSSFDWQDSIYDNIIDIRQLITSSVQSNGDTLFLKPFEKEITEMSFNGIFIWACGFETFLNENKIKMGDRVAVMFHNSSLMVLLFLSTLFSGRVFVPINPYSSSNEVDYIINTSKVNLFLFDNIFKQFNKPIYSRLKKISVKEHVAFIDRIKTMGKNKSDIDPLDENPIAQIVYTSGTTGKPKGVVLSHKNLLADSFGLGKTFNFNKSDNFLTIAPLFHNSGQILTTLAPLWCGSNTTAVRSDMGLINFWNYVDRFKINWSLGMAAHVNFLIESDSHPLEKTLKGFFCGGSKLDLDNQEIFEKRFKIPVFTNYGLTETTSIATCRMPDDQTFSIGSVGKSLPINKIKIVNEKQNKIFNQRVGEIMIKGDNLFQGYFKDPKLTSNKIKDGWFNTGDLGYFDINNNLFIVDRIDNMIIVGGENVYPIEVESILSKIKEISEGLLLSRPHKILGNELVLVFKLRKGASENVKEWSKIIQKNVSAFKVPKVFVNINLLEEKEIPKSPNGKVLRGKTKELLVTYFNKLS